MNAVTIVVEDESMTVENERVHKARLVWRSAGLDVYVLGSIAGWKKQDQARHLAMAACIERHIPVVSLRLQCGCDQKKHPSTNIDMYKKGLL